MKTTDPKHLTGSLNHAQKDVLESGSKQFSEIIGSALGDVNRLQQESAQLSQLMITDPDQVDVHDVTIAMGKANLAVSITKAVVDGAIKAYKEIINMR
ncbi:MAG: flagellar hook-basal body complex protein FliE [Spirochaetales bacterium]|nr:flagellar hook-basal body complex protein FliE [Spirochaetales bacterium]